MIVKSYINNNLKQIESLYNNAASTKKALFFSKLAILELCGWIEVSMDDVIKRHATRNLKIITNRGEIDKRIKKTYGFDYKSHFRPLLISTIGLIGVERLEKNTEPFIFDPMVATLSSLKLYRNQEAHEYIKGTTRRLDAPSRTIQMFYTVLNGLKHIDFLLRSKKY